MKVRIVAVLVSVVIAGCNASTGITSTVPQPTDVVTTTTTVPTTPMAIDEAAVRTAVSQHIVSDTAGRLGPDDGPIECSYSLLGSEIGPADRVIAVVWGFCELIRTGGTALNHAIRFDLAPVTGGYVVVAMEKAEKGEPEGYPATVRRVFPAAFVDAVLAVPDWDAMTLISP